MIKAGQKLYEERTRRGISIEDVSQATKIRPSFISAIERGEYGSLPSQSYAQGFVRSYIKFLDLPEEETMAVFRREFDAKKTFKVLPEGLAREEFSVNRFKLKQTFVVIGIFFLILILYVLFQYRYAIINPPLNVFYPKDNATLSAETIAVTGSTNPDSTVYVNDNPVAVDGSGAFKKEIDVVPGENKIIVKSINRFGRETTLIRTIKVQ